MPKNRQLLVIGPSFRRNISNRLMPVFERYDGLFFRVAKKHINRTKTVDIVVMLDDLTLVDESSPISYVAPKGRNWGSVLVSKIAAENARTANGKYIQEKLSQKKYSEVFLAMGKEYAKALPDMTSYKVKVVFPSGGPGPKAAALRDWLRKQRPTKRP